MVTISSNYNEIGANSQTFLRNHRSHIISINKLEASIIADHKLQKHFCSKCSYSCTKKFSLHCKLKVKVVNPFATCQFWKP